jgi:uncharacterized membrane protein YraQ (UPF0718 family)
MRMTATLVPFPISRLRCHYRPLILAVGAASILCVFWFASRYPQLVAKSGHVGEALPSMAYSSEVLQVAADAPLWQKIAFGAVNWLDSMKIGMSFGVLFGAWLHTLLRYYPLKIGKNLYLNSLKGALVGAPAGVCANCAVPMACGVTRGNGRVEVALGFLFSSPNFNPVVVMMTFAALPWTMSVTKYGILLVVILGIVPVMISWLERSQPLKPFTVGDEHDACAVNFNVEDCSEPFWSVFREMAQSYSQHVWMLLKPTITLMLLASLVSSALLTLIPWQSVLSEFTPLRAAGISLVAVFMPVPIALDVMFAGQLQQQGVASGYVMLFAMTLGTYSIIPSIYLWREVSRRLAVLLFVLFMAIGWATSLLF